MHGEQMNAGLVTLSHDWQRISHRADDGLPHCPTYTSSTNLRTSHGGSPAVTRSSRSGRSSVLLVIGAQFSVDGGEVGHDAPVRQASQPPVVCLVGHAVKR